MTIERVESRKDPANPNLIHRRIHKVETPSHVILKTRQADPNNIDLSPVPYTAIDIIDSQTIKLITYEEGEVFKETLVGEGINHRSDDLTIGDQNRGKILYRYRNDAVQSDNPVSNDPTYSI